MASSPTNANSDSGVQQAIEMLQIAVVEADNVSLTSEGSRTDSMQEEVFLECEKFRCNVKNETDQLRKKLHSISSQSRSRITIHNDNIDSDNEDFRSFESSMGGVSTEISSISCSGESEGACSTTAESDVDHPQFSSGELYIRSEEQLNKSLEEKNIHGLKGLKREWQSLDCFPVSQFSSEVSCPGTPMNPHDDDDDSVFPSPPSRDYTPISSPEHGPAGICPSALASPKFVYAPRQTVMFDDGDHLPKQEITGSSTVSPMKANFHSPQKSVFTMSPICARFLRSSKSSSRSLSRLRIGSESTVLEEVKVALEKLCYIPDANVATFQDVLDRILNISKHRISNSSNEMTEIVCHFFKLFVTYPKSVYHIAVLCIRIYEDPLGGDEFLGTVFRQVQLELNYVLKIVCTVKFIDKRVLGLIWFMSELHLNLPQKLTASTDCPKFLVLAIAELLRTLLDIRGCPHLITSFHCAVQVLKIVATSLCGTGYGYIDPVMDGLEKLRGHCKKLEMLDSLSIDLQNALMYISLHIQLIKSRVLKEMKSFPV